uniref:Uncharacterized protein n=1 Tax=Trichobilharzia regenti TaxID=157069 RepID=A0AA85K3K4_TRIRE|nr:unnamed protein product [Trichobilharzia regenti]
MLNCSRKREANARLNGSVYRKSIHKPMFGFAIILLYVSKRLVKCFSNRAQKLSSIKENLRQEVRHVREALESNNCLNKLIRKYVGKYKNEINNSSNDSDNNNNINDDMHVKHARIVITPIIGNLNHQ